MDFTPRQAKWRSISFYSTSPPAKWCFSATALHPRQVPESKARCAGSASLEQLVQVEINRHPVVLLGAWGRPLRDIRNSLAVTFCVLSLPGLCFQEEEPNLVATPMFDILVTQNKGACVLSLPGKGKQNFQDFATVQPVFTCATQGLWWAERNTGLGEHCKPENFTSLSLVQCYQLFQHPSLQTLPSLES